MEIAEVSGLASLIAENGPYIICLVFMLLQQVMQNRNYKEQTQENNKKVNEILDNMNHTLKTLSENILVLNERVGK